MSSQCPCVTEAMISLYVHNNPQLNRIIWLCVNEGVWNVQKETGCHNKRCRAGCHHCMKPAYWSPEESTFSALPPADFNNPEPENEKYFDGVSDRGATANSESDRSAMGVCATDRLQVSTRRARNTSCLRSVNALRCCSMPGTSPAAKSATALGGKCQQWRPVVSVKVGILRGVRWENGWTRRAIRATPCGECGLVSYCLLRLLVHACFALTFGAGFHAVTMTLQRHFQAHTHPPSSVGRRRGFGNSTAKAEECDSRCSCWEQEER